MGVISCNRCRTEVRRFDIDGAAYCPTCRRWVSTVIVVPPGACSLPFDWIELP